VRQVQSERKRGGTGYGDGAALTPGQRRRRRRLDGRMRTGAETYERLSSAKRALTLIEAQLVTGEWTDPVGGKLRLQAYAERWIVHQAGLRPRTRELYTWLLAAHIMPYLGAMPLGSITPTPCGSGVPHCSALACHRQLRPRPTGCSAPFS
jgi:integrase-like protein